MGLAVQYNRAREHFGRDYYVALESCSVNDKFNDVCDLKTINAVKIRDWQ